MQYRHERKHVIHYGDYLVLKSKLQAVMQLDKHVSEKGFYEINSLYFDNINDKILQEKVNGCCDREKFRIRYYDQNTEYIRLEKKVKNNGLGYKIQCPIMAEDIKKLLAGDTEWMPHSKEALVVELYEKMKTQGLRPKTIVQYKRDPFVYSAGNVRVTLDYDIRTGIHTIDFLNPNVALIPASEGTVILEVKYDAYLPDMIRDVIQLENRQESGFSKYVTCRRFG